jgi:CubicO group peptidase (beta-lactamase class C family)
MIRRRSIIRCWKNHPAITIADLLHWASGLDWQEDYEYAPLKSSVVAMLYTRGHRDMAAFTANHPAYAAPGQAFRYSSGDSNLLSAALKTIVGPQRYPDYPWTALFEPLGIRHAVWETDASGTFVASSYAYLTARDLARVGLLMMRDGRWGERQLLPKDWLAFNRTPFAGYKAHQDEAVPGGQWWLNRPVDGAASPWPDAPADTFAALGHWGQALYVIPSEKLVIVRYGDDRDGSYRHNELLKLACLRRCSHEVAQTNFARRAADRVARLDLARTRKLVGLPGHHQRLHGEGILFVPLRDEQRCRILSRLRKTVAADQRLQR